MSPSFFKFVSWCKLTIKILFFELSLALLYSNSLLLFFNPENKTTAAQPTSREEKNFTVANTTFFAVVNNTMTTEKNDTDKNRQRPSTVKNKIILCIQIFGCVDIFLICTYSALCIYDRQHRAPGKLNAYENVPGNNSTYENAGIFFLSGTGNQLL